MPKGPVDRGYVSGGGIGAMGIAAGKAAMSRVVTKASVKAVTRSSPRQVAMKTAKKQSSKPKSLYHGTSSDVKPGQRLSSSSSATKYYEFANRFAKAGGAKGRVYKVKAPSDVRKIPKWDAARQDEWQSQRGFTVAKQAKPPKQSLAPQMRTSTKPKSSRKK